MAIRVTCESCDHEFTTRDDNAGRRVRCPECSEPISVSAKRKGKSKKKSGGNQTVLIASIAGGVVAVAAIVIAVVMSSGGGGNNVASNNSAPAAGSTTPNAVAPGEMVPATATLPANASEPSVTVAGPIRVREPNPSELVWGVIASDYRGQGDPSLAVARHLSGIKGFNSEVVLVRLFDKVIQGQSPFVAIYVGHARGLVRQDEFESRMIQAGFVKPRFEGADPIPFDPKWTADLKELDWSKNSSVQ